MTGESLLRHPLVRLLFPSLRCIDWDLIAERLVLWKYSTTNETSTLVSCKTKLLIKFLEENFMIKMFLLGFCSVFAWLEVPMCQQTVTCSCTCLLVNNDPGKLKMVENSSGNASLKLYSGRLLKSFETANNWKLTILTKSFIKQHENYLSLHLLHSI